MVHKLKVFQPEWQFQIITSKKASGIRIGHLPAAKNYHSIFFCYLSLACQYWQMLMKNRHTDAQK